MNEYIGSGAIIVLVALCIKLANGVVKKTDCHRAQDSLKEFFNQRLEDLKDFIRNGSK